MPSLELKYCNDKVWVENPRSCQNLKKTECQPETKFKTVKKPSQKCGRVAYDDCQNVPYEKCDLITKQDCQNESFQVIFNLRLLHQHLNKKFGVSSLKEKRHQARNFTVGSTTE